MHASKTRPREVGNVCTNVRRRGAIFRRAPNYRLCSIGYGGLTGAQSDDCPSIFSFCLIKGVQAFDEVVTVLSKKQCGKALGAIFEYSAFFFFFYAATEPTDNKANRKLTRHIPNPEKLYIVTQMVGRNVLLLYAAVCSLARPRYLDVHI